MEFSITYYKNIFLQKFNELERYHLESSNYSLIQASNPVRFLLYDTQPLVDMLNKDKQLPITYCVNGDEWHEKESGLLPVIEWKEVNPGLSGNPVELKKDAFLKFKCLYFLENPYTVQDILKFYAYVRGGIHLDKGEEKYQPLREAFYAFQLNGLSSLDHSMRGIVQVIYTTLSKYKEALLAD